MRTRPQRAGELCLLGWEKRCARTEDGWRSRVVEEAGRLRVCGRIGWRRSSAFVPTGEMVSSSAPRDVVQVQRIDIAVHTLHALLQIIDSPSFFFTRILAGSRAHLIEHAAHLHHVVACLIQGGAAWLGSLTWGR